MEISYKKEKEKRRTLEIKREKERARSKGRGVSRVPDTQLDGEEEEGSEG